MGNYWVSTKPQNKTTKNPKRNNNHKTLESQYFSRPKPQSEELVCQEEISPWIWEEVTTLLRSKLKSSLDSVFGLWGQNMIHASVKLQNCSLDVSNIWMLDVHQIAERITVSSASFQVMWTRLMIHFGGIG